MAIADPPYLRRSVRWYGGGAGYYDDPRVAADVHPDAAEWDDPARHVALVHQLELEFDSWAIAMAPDSLPVYLSAAPHDARVMVWHRGNAVPSAARVACNWEPVLVKIAQERKSHRAGLGVSDVLSAGVQKLGFVGAKPAAWTRWILDVLAYRPGEDDLTDMFPGSGAVSSAIDGMLNIASDRPFFVRRSATPAKALQQHIPLKSLS